MFSGTIAGSMRLQLGDDLIVRLYGHRLVVVLQLVQQRLRDHRLVVVLQLVQQRLRGHRLGVGFASMIIAYCVGFASMNIAGTCKRHTTRTETPQRGAPAGGKAESIDFDQVDLRLQAVPLRTPARLSRGGACRLHSRRLAQDWQFWIARSKAGLTAGTDLGTARHGDHRLLVHSLGWLPRVSNQSDLGSAAISRL